MLHVVFLGGFSLTLDGRMVDRPVRPRVQSLLALLILNAGKPLPREWIGECLWPERTPEQSLGNVRRLLFDLRHELPEIASIIRANVNSLLWPGDADWTADVQELERAARDAEHLTDIRKAAELYRGDLLPSCYDDWIVPERERLRSLFLDLLWRAVMKAEQEGDVLAALDYARRLLAEEPLREDAHRTLMRLYTLSGDRGAALRTYHLCAATLERELGVEPAPATRDAYELLIGHAPSHAGVAAPGRLIGREREWNRLQAAWRAVELGGSRVATLIGEPGIGKTRLLDELGSWARHRSIRTMYTRGYETEGPLAYAPVVTLLRSAPLPELDAVWMTEVSRLLPELAPTDQSLMGVDVVPWGRERLFEALARVMLAKQPLLLLVDDIQWVDRDTLEWLHYLLRHGSAAGLLLVCASRPEGPHAGDPGVPWWPDLMAAGRLDEIEVGPLEPTAAAQLALNVDAGLDEESARHVWSETGGNPLLIIESVRAQSDPRAAASIGKILAARFAELSPTARDVAATAALIGRAFRLPLLIAASGHDERDVIAGLDELWRYRIVREQGTDAYDFAHDRLREAALAATSPPARQLGHARVAQALESLSGPRVEQLSGEIASHLEAAADPVRAGHYHVRAGRAAIRVYAYDEATRHFRRALALLPEEESVEAMLGLSETLYETASLEEAEVLCRRALARIAGRGDERTEASIQYLLGLNLRAQGRPTEAVELLERAEGAFARVGTEPARARALVHLGGARAMMGSYSQGLDLLHEADQIARGTGDLHVAMFAASGLGFCYLEAGDARRAEEWQLKMLRLSEQDENPLGTASALQNLGLIAVEQERYAEAIEWSARALEQHTALRALANCAEDVSALGQAYGRLGVLEAAERCHLVAAHMAARASHRVVLNLNRVNLARIALERDEPERAEPLVRAALVGLEQAGMPRLRFEALRTMIDVLERSGRLEEAAALAHELCSIATQLGRDDLAFLSSLLSARLDALSGRRKRGDSIRALQAMLAAASDPVQRAAVHYASWRLEPERDEDREAAAELYRTLHEERGTALYRERYQELSGQGLPAPESPQLPEAVQSYPGSRASLLTELTRDGSQPIAS